MSESVQPIFLFSLPRSVSTLLQRILAKHTAIDTAAEPWVLLPLTSALRSEGIYTSYDQNAVVDASGNAVGEFQDALGHDQDSGMTAMAWISIFARSSTSART